MDELDIISGSIFDNVHNYDDPDIQGVSDPEYNEETNRYEPSKTFYFKNGTSASLWLYGGKIVDSLHPCIIWYNLTDYKVVYYSSIMKKYNQARFISYNIESKITSFAKELIGFRYCEVYKELRIHENEDEFLASVLVRDLLNKHCGEN